MGRLSLHSSSGSRTAARVAQFAALAFAFGAAAGPAHGAGVSGRVLLAEDPVAKATVYAYRVVERSFEKVATDESGRFLFESLPAGLYKIVAHKIGLSPAVLVLARRSADEPQFVQMELASSKAEPEDDYWSTRATVPGDVLRELNAGTIELASAVTHDLTPPRFIGEVAAMAGMSDLATADASDVAGTEIALHGLVGALRVELQGELQRAGAGAPDAADGTPGGRSSSFRLGLAGEGGTHFDVEGDRRQWFAGAETASAPLAVDHVQLRYSGEVGDQVETSLAANYLDESGLFRRGMLVPAVFPSASRWLTVEGAYSLPLGDLGSLHGGVRYRESDLHRMSIFDQLAPTKYLDVWSNGQAELDSTYLLEYGVYSTFRDGRVSVTPRGGVVVRFGPRWQASVSASQRVLVSDEHPFEGDITPSSVERVFACEDSESSCYEAEVSRGQGDEPTFSVSGSWREFDKTVRLFLDDDLLYGGEGVFFVPGDQMPEMKATLRQQFGDTIVASWSTSYADGGGGNFLAANRRAYQNGVTYLRSSIDTRFQPTQTGVFLAFHRVEQRLTANQPQNGRGRAKSPSTELEQVEIVVSQDLSEIFDLARSWAVTVGMELVRGQSFVNPIDEGGDTRRKITTGVAVRF